MNKNQIIGFLIGTTFSMFLQAEKLRKELEDERRRTLKAVRLIHFMADIIDKNDVVVDEFDAIAVSELVREVRED